MDILTGIVVYFITWFVVLFTVLPWGVRTQLDEGDVTPGTSESAPVNPAIKKKMFATTLVSAILFGIFWATIEYELIDFRAIIQG